MTRRAVRRLAVAVAAAAVAACAPRGPLDAAGVDPTVTPRSAVAALAEARGRTAEWGGVLLHATNLEDATELEVLAYPLDRRGSPRADDDPLGRFVARRTGFLDPAEYAPGRRVTVVGPVTGTLPGRIGERSYTYPVIAADQIHLWPRTDRPSEPRVHFGIGVIFH